MKTLPRMLCALLCSTTLTGLVSAAPQSPEGAAVLTTLTRANDKLIEASLAQNNALPAGSFGGTRGVGAQIMVLAAAYTNDLSQFHHDARLVAAMEQGVGVLRENQLPDGLFDGGNLDSPPDSSFVLKTLCKAQLFLTRDNREQTVALRGQLKDVLLKLAEGVRTGGIHTPNHRWAVCTSLAHVNALYPDAKWVERIDDWLGEGLDVDADGQWAERSPNYTSDVNNPATVDLAILLNRPTLLDAVRRSLDMSVYHFEPNGEVETVASRRQDQRAGVRKHIYDYYYPYRYLAIRDQNATYAAVARWIEGAFMPELGEMATNMSSPLTCLLEFPEMTKAMPASAPLPDNYAKVFPLTAMARLRHGTTTATVYGGSDWFAGLGSGSGIATNPTFFKMRKGAAILESLRMAPSFFSTGFFYSQGLKAEGGQYVLSQTLAVPYHLPLPKDKRNPQGQYRLSPDMVNEHLLGRYFSRMDFANRPSHHVTLKTEVRVTEVEGGYELAFDVSGYDRVPVTLELAFRSGGTLAGVTPVGAGAGGRGGRGNRGGPMIAEDTAGAFVLKEGWGTYTVGADKITFGPGALVRPPGRMEGETITWVGGSLRAEGERVYLTGMTPWRYKLILK